MTHPDNSRPPRPTMAERIDDACRVFGNESPHGRFLHALQRDYDALRSRCERLEGALRESRDAIQVIRGEQIAEANKAGIQIRLDLADRIDAALAHTEQQPETQS